MPEPWELTDEEAAAEAAELKERRRAADRAAGRLFSEMHALLEGSDEDLEKLPPEEAEYIRQYRNRFSADDERADPSDVPGYLLLPSGLRRLPDVSPRLGESGTLQLVYDAVELRDLDWCGSEILISIDLDERRIEFALEVDADRVTGHEPGQIAITIVRPDARPAIVAKLASRTPVVDMQFSDYVPDEENDWQIGVQVSF